MNCNDIIRLLEAFCPPEYALEWDNVGLIVGERHQEIHTIMVALDATDSVIDEAIEKNVDMIVTHHPILFRGMKQINGDDFIGRKIMKLIQHGICCYAMHTNYDVAGDMCRILAEKLQLVHSEVLSMTSDDGLGIGLAGQVKEASLKSFAAQVKTAIQIPYLTMYGEEHALISRVAISPGSGKGMIGAALEKGVQVLVTGDIDYHTAIDSIQQGLMILDPGHFATEKIMVSRVHQYLIEQINVINNKVELPVEIIEAKLENPFKII